MILWNTLWLVLGCRVVVGVGGCLWETPQQERRRDTEKRKPRSQTGKGLSSQVGCHPQGEATVADKALNVAVSHEKLPAGPLFISDCYYSGDRDYRSLAGVS